MPKAFKYISLVIILTVFFSTSAQNIQDSLYKLNYEELEEVFRKNNFDDRKKAELATKVFISKAKKEFDSSKIARGFYLYHFTTDINEPNHILALDSTIFYSEKNQTKEQPALAYFSKAQYYLYQERNIAKTLKNVNIARKYSTKNQNIDLKYRIDYMIGIIKSEHLDEKQEALKIYKSCESYYKNKPERQYKFKHLNTLHAIAETYIGLKKYDSTTFYNKLGYSEAATTNDLTLQNFKAYFVLCEGINKYINKQYNAAIDSINNALPYIGDISNTIDSYYYLGKSYHDLHNTKQAVVYFKKTDSILETIKSIPQYKHVKTYEYLKNYFKEINDLENQNKYLSKLNTILGEYLNDQISISKKVKLDYDIPKLKEEQQIVIKKLNKNTSNYIFSLLVLSVFILILSVLLYRQYRKRKIYQLRFNELMKKSNSEKITVRNKIEPITKTEETKELQVPEKHVKYILEKLKAFEEEKGFLAIGVTSQLLADDIDTNVKYLSRVINHYKNKTFTNYINELRINHAVKELRENEMLRKFTIKAIANEFGYSRAETFSNVFYKQVKIKPSYYIKQLIKSEL